MDKKLKAKWVKALRSGRYKQTNGCLKDSRGYCCLGVLANIQGAKWKETVHGNLLPHVAHVQISPKDGAGFLLPRYAGGLASKTQRKLADMNDGLGMSTNMQSFRQIADYIEKNL